MTGHAMTGDAATPDAARQACQRFPRGLSQPEGGFRFGADTLLLAAFAAGSLPKGAVLSGLELGCGCGAASLGLLLLAPQHDISLSGLDLDPDMAAAANANARLLGLDRRFRALQGDAGDFRLPGMHLALMNPPFRIAGTGRGAATPQKHRARFEGPGGLGAFLACAARCLRPQGRLYLVHLAERLPDLLRQLGDHGLNPARLLPVHGGQDKPARLVLLEAVRGGRGALTLMPGLVLYGPGGELTRQATEFCPFLAVNPRRPRGVTP